MRRKLFLLSLLLLIAAPLSSLMGAVRPSVPVVDAVFLENGGQYPPRVRFQTTGREPVAAVRGGLEFYLSRNKLGLHILFGDGSVEPIIEARAAGVAHFLRAATGGANLTNISRVHAIRYRDVWPRVDVVVRPRPDGLDYDVVLQPGADLGAVEVAYEGADALLVDKASRRLTVRAHEERWVEEIPRAWEERSGSVRVLEARFVLRGRNRVGFEVPSWDGTRQLVIDPRISFVTTYLGGSKAEAGRSLAAGPDGSLYLASGTSSRDFPVTADALESGPPPTTVSTSNYVTKFRPTPRGYRLAYSTYFGTEVAAASILDLAVDEEGAIYLTGRVVGDGPEFSTEDAFSPDFNGGFDDAFVAKISPDGRRLEYCTFLGGAGSEVGRAIAVDALGRAHVTGETDSTNFPTTGGVFQEGFMAVEDAFVTRLSPTADRVEMSTYFGGSGQDVPLAIALHPHGGIFIGGRTASKTVPLCPTADVVGPTHAGGTHDGFIAHLTRIGRFGYCTHLGGSNIDVVTGLTLYRGGRQWGELELDLSATVYATGLTLSSDFPLAGQPLPTPEPDWREKKRNVFVSWLAPGAKRLLYSTYLGGSGDEGSARIDSDERGGFTVTGWTESENFPLTRDAIQSRRAASKDAFVTRFSRGGRLAYSTFLGGREDDVGLDVVVLDRVPFSLSLFGRRNRMMIAVSGGTFSDDMPLGADPFGLGVRRYDAFYNGSRDAFLTVIEAPRN